MKTACEIIRGIQPGKSPYEKTLYLIYNYRDLKSGASITDESREVLSLIDEAVKTLEDDTYISILKSVLAGKKAEQIANDIPLDINSVYRHRRRLIKRLSIVIYGDEALY